MASNTACLDTNILIYAVQLPNYSSEPELVHRAHSLFQDLTKKKITIVVPSMVMAEFTYGLTGQALVAASNALSTIRILPFDYAAVQQYQIINAIVPLAAPTRSIRIGLNMDRMIIATALANNVDCFYTHDGDCMSVATQCRLNALDLPNLPPEQMILL